MDIREKLKRLMETAGPSGHEHAVAALMRDSFAEYTKEINCDALGSLTAWVRGKGKGKRPRVMLAAHMDEIALMVSKVEKGGFLRVTAMGGVDARTLLAQEVEVHTEQGVLRGVVGTKPPHLTRAEERKKTIPLESLFIDLAMPERQVRERVQVGDCVTIHRRAMDLQNGWIAGKSLDNRASLAALLVVLEELSKLHVQADVLLTATVQEELGLRGAGPAAFSLQPDLAIAVDVTFGKLPGQAPDQSLAVGGGPAIAFGPNIHRQIYTQLLDTARQWRIPFQIELTQGATGTDAWAMQVVREGIPTGLVSIPLRYMHTSVETVDVSDIVMTGKLLAYFIASLNQEFVEGLRCYLKN